MDYAEIKRITTVKRKKFDGATGNGTDQSVDPGYKRDPNDFLAPTFGQTVFTNFLMLVGLVAIVIVATKAYQKYLN